MMEKTIICMNEYMDQLRGASELCISAHSHMDLVPFTPNELMRHRFLTRESEMHFATVTCCIAFGNDHHFLELALNSIYTQTTPPQNVLVGIDNGIDETCDKKNSPVGHIEYHNFIGSHGPYVIMDQLIRRATSEFILLMDSDDIAHPDRLSILIDIAQSTGADFVGSAALHMDESGTKSIGADVFPPFPRDALSRNMCHPALYPTLLFRRAAFIDLGGFAKFESFGMDSEFIYRASRYHNFQNVHLPLYIKRDRATSLTNNPLTGMESERRRRVIDFTYSHYRDLFDVSE